MIIHVGIIGVGYWGPNFVRNFTANKKCKVTWVCDLSDKALSVINRFYPSISLTKDYKEILADKEVDLVMIATPPRTHFSIAKDSLQANKHIIVAKPLTTDYKEAEELYNLAKNKKLLLHGDLTYLYTPATRYIKSFVQKQKLGKPLYYDSIRANLGLIQKDVSVIWDLAPHDFAILDFCFGLKPQRIFASASNHYGKDRNYEMAHITIDYENNFIAHIHISWLNPVKLRTIFLGGTKKMILYDDVEPDEKIKIYNKGIDLPPESVTAFKPIYRSGDIVIPKLSNYEAISLEISEIIKQINTNSISYDNAQINLQIIQLLEACDLSIIRNKPILL